MPEKHVYKDRNNLNWQIYHYRPNTIIASLLLVVCILLTYIVFFHPQSEWDVLKVNSVFEISVYAWFWAATFALIYAATIQEIFKRLFQNYITGICFRQKDMHILYVKGNAEPVSYDEIGFVHFNLTEGDFLHKRFHPSFSFYRKDETSKILDDVLRKKEFLIFKGEVSNKEDYLTLKDYLNGKGIYFHEPKETLDLFEKQH